MTVYNEFEIIKPTPLRVGKSLRCGCCGQDFQVWEGYEDQDQDNGYGICKGCQKWEDELNEAEYDKAIALLSGALNEKNKAKFDSMNRDQQKRIAWQAIEDGKITWEIKPQQVFPITNLIK